MADESGDEGGNRPGDTERDRSADIEDTRSEDGNMACPSCGDALPAEARFCPYCETAIDEAGEPVDLSDLDGLFEEGEQPEFLRIDEAGQRRASGRVRALAGLAVAVPLAPLALFLVGSVVTLSAWMAAGVFVVSWLCCGAALSRARVPIEAFGRSLYLLAVGTALIPVVLAVGDAGPIGDTTTTTYRVVATASLVIAGGALLVARWVSFEGERRVTGERRAFEDLRDDGE